MCVPEHEHTMCLAAFLIKISSWDAYLQKPPLHAKNPRDQKMSLMWLPVQWKVVRLLAGN